MNDERFEQLLNEMKSVDASGPEVDAATDRVWARIESAASGCGHLRGDLAAYNAGTLPESRRLLVEDHIARCVACRNAVRGAQPVEKVAVMPRRSFAARVLPWAAAAGIAFAGIYSGRDSIDAALAPSGPRAEIASISGRVFDANAQPLAVGAKIEQNAPVHTAAASHAVLRMADGSLVEMNERTQLSLRAAWSGASVMLDRGDVIVQAAKQRRGHLRVMTRDTRVSVKGTIFGVSAASTGSIVSVVEGAVQVEHSGQSKLLGGGDQDASSNKFAGGSVRDAIAWSENAEKYYSLLGELAAIEKRIAAIPMTLRTDPKMLRYLPPSPVIYAALPNSTAALREARALLEQRMRENAALRSLLDEHGKHVTQLLDSLNTLSPLLGDEVVFVLSGTGREMQPALLAEAKASQDEIGKALQGLNIDGGPLTYRVQNGLFVATGTAAQLNQLVATLGQGATSPFATDIRARYQRGAGWLLGVNLEAMVARSDASDRQVIGVLGASNARRVFFEQRQVGGADQNEAGVSFSGARTGIASWLAAPGAGAAAEYITPSAVMAVAASTRNPQQALDELITMLSTQTKFAEELREFEAKAGIRVSADLAGALGTDFAYAVETPTLPLPGTVWVMEVLRPGTLDGSIARMVEAFNGQLPADRQTYRVTLTKETVNGREWTSVKSAISQLSLHWTYDRGYMVASTDRAIATRAIATRNGGTPLVRSAVYRDQMPVTATVHNSGFFWLNTKGALTGLLPGNVPPSFQALLDSRDPILTVIEGQTERISAASRTRLTSLLFDLALVAPNNHVRTSH